MISALRAARTYSDAFTVEGEGFGAHRTLADGSSTIVERRETLAEAAQRGMGV